MTFLRALRSGSSFLSPLTSILWQYQCHPLLHRAVHPVFHAWTKDAEFDYHFILREKVAYNEKDKPSTLWESNAQWFTFFREFIFDLFNSFFN